MRALPSARSVSLRPEFRLLVECCRHGFAAGPRPDLAPALGAVDFHRFAALAARHRVEGLAWAALDGCHVNLPAPVADCLRSRARTIAEQGLRSTLHSARLERAFVAAGIPLLFVKGLAVAALAYRDPFAKMAWDIDILVAPEAVGAAAALLDALGHALVVPGHAHAASIVEWHRLQKESTWRSPHGQHVELHSRLADSPALIPSVGMNSAQQTVAVAPGVALTTLAGDDLFAYLCVHGASSAWFRLKWVSDLAALLIGAGGEEIERLYHASQRLGAGRAAAQALLLIDALFGLPLTGQISRGLRRDPFNRILLRTALGQLLNDREPTERPLGTLMIHLGQLPLGRGAGFAAHEAMRQLRTAFANRGLS